MTDRTGRRARAKRHKDRRWQRREEDKWAHYFAGFPSFRDLLRYQFGRNLGRDVSHIPRDWSVEPKSFSGLSGRYSDGLTAVTDEP